MTRSILSLTSGCALVLVTTCGCSGDHEPAPGTDSLGPAAAAPDQPKDATSALPGILLPPGMTLSSSTATPLAATTTLAAATPPAVWRDEVTNRLAVGQYAIRAGTDGLAANNRAQHLNAQWRGSVVRIAASEREPMVLRTTGIARGHDRVVAAGADFAAGTCQRDGARDELDHCLQRAESKQSRWLEWWENRSGGLEHGFDFAEPPLNGVAGEPLRIEVAVEGAQIEVDADGRGATLATALDSFRYAGLSARDAEGRDLRARMVASAGGLALEIDDGGAKYPIRVDPVFSNVAWSAEGNVADASFGFKVASAGDVDADGYGDVVVGAYGYSNGQIGEGKVFLYRGSATGLQTTASWTVESNQAAAYMGSVASAGDVNRDGFADVIVGAWLYDNGNTDEGRVDVYYGSATGLPATPSWSAEGNQNTAYFGYSVASAGDMNGDTYGDIIIGAPRFSNGETEEGKVFVYYGGPTGLGASPNYVREGGQVKAYLGQSVDGAGDIDFDGCSDVVMGAPGYDAGTLTDAGRVLVTTGGHAGVGTVWGFDGTFAGGFFGYSVAGAGDVNGDNMSDFIVGAPSEGNGESGEGRAYVYAGKPQSLRPALISTTESNQANASYGFSVGSAGDLNGDGYADVLIGAPNYDHGQTNEGRVYGYFGSNTGIVAKAFTRESNQAEASFGISVGSAGDTNGDGWSEMLVGAYQYDAGEANEGRAFLYSGVSGHYQTTPGWSVTGTVQDDRLGSAVASAGDVNGDGYGDVIVGEPLYDHGQTDEGRVLVYLGSTTGPSTTAAWSVESNVASSNFGSKVASAGDVNGDGYGDVIVGASLYTNGQFDEGAAYVYLGSATGLATTAAWMVEGNVSSELFGGSVASAGDVNGDGYGDVVVGATQYANGQFDEGGAFLYLGGPSGLATSPAWVGEGNQTSAGYGRSVASAGDVNRDGYGDVIVGAHLYDNGQTNEGRAFVYLGSASGLATSPVWTAEPNVANARFGSSVAGAGDLGNDGFGDVIVGAAAYTNGEASEGAVYVYRGASSGVAAVAAGIYEGNVASAYLGSVVASAGDVDGDGFGDVLMTSDAYSSNTGYVLPCYGTGANVGAPINCGAPQLIGDQGSAMFGTSAASAGDVNGDGYGDLIIGSQQYDTTVLNVGRAGIYLGNAQDGSNLGKALALQARRPNLTTPIPPHGRSASTAGFDAAMLRPTNPWGYGRVKLQVEAKPLGTAFDGTGVLTTNWVQSGVSNIAKLLVGPGVGGNTPHWRARLLYDPVQTPIFQRSRWIYGGLSGEPSAAALRIAP